MGSDSLQSASKLVHEMCKEISNIRMERPYRRGGHTFITPDKLCDKFISLTTGLPPDVSNWSITQCNSLFNYLPSTLQDKMEDNTFVMPNLNNQITKSLQLGVLRTVRVVSLSSYKNLVEDESRIRRLFPSNGNDQGSLFVIGLETYYPINTGSVNFHGSYLVENTIVSYGDQSDSDPLTCIHILELMASFTLTTRKIYLIPVVLMPATWDASSVVPQCTI